VSRSAPDGYTMLLINTIAHSAAAIITPDVQYNSVDNFTAVGAIGDTQYMLIENPNFAPDYAAAIEKIKASPGTYNFASSGIGSAPHLVMELFMAKAGLDMVHIPYGGSGPALNDVVAGTVPLMFENVAAVELIKAGQLKALATTGDARQETFPDVPTFTEVGLKDFDIAAHWGLIAPAGVPADVIETLNSALNKALQDPNVAQSLTTQGIAAKPGSADDYNKLLASEATRWKGVIEDAGIHP
jgi:tripartite-type tricarboxylate transporter receptor subunit TctC